MKSDKSAERELIEGLFAKKFSREDAVRFVREKNGEKKLEGYKIGKLFAEIGELFPLLIFYDRHRKEYLRRNSRGVWLSLTEGQARRNLVALGLSPKPPENDPLSEVDRRLLEIRDRSHVDFSGALAGCGEGFREIDSARILVTSGPALITPAPGAWPNLKRFLETLLADDPAQMPVVLGWLKTSIEALLASAFRPGQALAIAGPRNCGKSLFQKLLTVFFGNRFARPYSFMAGKTDFNSDLFGAEHLAVEDDVPSVRIEDRRNFGAKIKEITANEGQRLHAKHRDAILLPVFWRLTISVNDEPENLMILPPMDESLQDKIILLRACKAQLPCETETREGRERCWQILTSELPACLAYLLAWKIPDALRSQRYGVTHFHHPEILRALAELSPESKLAELIDAELFSAPVSFPWNGTAAELERKLSASSQSAHDARRLFTFNNACGQYLSRLANKCPARYVKRHTMAGNSWTIHPPEAAPSVPE